MKPAIGWSVVLLLSVVAMSASGQPQEQERDRVFLKIGGPAADQARELMLLFEGPVLEYGGVLFAGTSEMDVVYGECREQMGASGSSERACRLQAARRVFVEEVLELEVKATKRGARMSLTAWNTSQNTKVFAALINAEGKGLDEALETGLVQLAERYLCYRGVAARCVDESAVVEATDSDPKETPEARVVVAPSSPAKPTLVSEERFEGAFRQVQFLPHEEGHWTLHAKDTTPLCALPCSRWLAENSGVYVAAMGSDGKKLASRIEVPEVGFGPDQPLRARPELNSDWQDWEVTTVVLEASGGVAFFGGFAMLVSGLVQDERSTALIATGGAVLGVGAIAFTVGGAYGGYKWLQDDGEDHLILEDAPKGSSVEVSWRSTF